MDKPERLNRSEDNPGGMVPAAGKHAARPSEVEVRESQPGGLAGASVDHPRPDLAPAASPDDAGPAKAPERSGSS